MEGGEVAPGHCWHLSSLSTPAPPGTKPPSAASTLEVPISSSLHITLVKWRRQKWKAQPPSLPNSHTPHKQQRCPFLRGSLTGPSLPRSGSYLARNQEGRTGLWAPSQRAVGPLWGSLPAWLLLWRTRSPHPPKHAVSLSRWLNLFNLGPLICKYLAPCFPED